jgi:hypothetical protein
MGYLYVPCIHIIIAENTTAYRTDKQSPFLNSKLYQSFTDQLMNNSVSAAGTIMSCSLIRWAFAGKKLVQAPSF